MGGAAACAQSCRCTNRTGHPLHPINESRNLIKVIQIHYDQIIIATVTSVKQTAFGEGVGCATRDIVAEK